jgi:hypothetical protein
MTVIAAGLGATFGCNQEITVGTPPTPVATRWMPFLSEGLKGNKRVVESEALYGGLIPLASHRAVVGYEAKGPASFELTDRRMGIFFQNMLGAEAVITAGTLGAPWVQTYALGNPVGMGMTIQIGRPTTAGAMDAFTYSGCKISEWEITAATGQIVKLNLTFDGMIEAGGPGSPSYVAPTYVETVPFNFTQGALLIGADAPIGIVKNISIKGAWGLDVDRFNIGSTTKSEQLVNGWLRLNTTCEIEFANTADLYVAYENDTEQQLVLSFATPLVDLEDSSASGAGVTITMPGTFADAGPPDVPGPAVITQKGAFTSLNPSNGDSPLTIVYQTADAAT